MIPLPSSSRLARIPEEAESTLFRSRCSILGLMTVELLFLACRGDDDHWRLPAARVSQTPIISNLTMQFVAKTWLAVSGVPKNHCYIGGVYRWLLGSIIPNYSLHIDLDFRSMYGVCHDKVENVRLFVTFDLECVQLAPSCTTAVSSDVK